MTGGTVRKQRIKQRVRRVVGEPYVGKRLKQIRLGKVLDQLAFDPRVILDAGSGDATFVYWLADRYALATVTAIDIDAAAIEACVAARPARYASRVDFETMRFDELPTSAFDLITVLDVLEHIEDDAAAARELARALRHGGSLLVHVPRNRWRTWSGQEKIVPDEEAWKVNPGHVRTGYSPESIVTLLQSVGLRIDDVQTWLGRWGVLAHSVYERLERPRPLRLLSIPITLAAARLESRGPTPDGNTVFVRATKPG